MAELIYGIRKIDNEVVRIEDIPMELRGLRCDCVCPQCKRPLVAKKGRGRENGGREEHFAHYFDPTGVRQSAGFDCDIEKANESALHLMAKQIIANECAIRVPKKLISPDEANMAKLLQEIDAYIPPYEYQKSNSITAVSVDLEIHLSGFTPDVVITTKRGKLLVEICVSHRVDEEKLEKVQKYNVAMLEIDLSSYLYTSLTRDKLRDIIINDEDCKHWIHYPLSDNAIKKAQDHYKNLDVVKTHLKNIAKKEAREEKIKLLFKPSNYANTLKKLRNDDEFLQTCAKIQEPHFFDFCKYFTPHRSVPFFIDIPITGEMIFQCDRRIWQSIIFNRFIYGRKNDNAKFNENHLFDVLRKNYNIPVDYDLTYKLPHPQYSDETIWLRREVIERYLQYLEVIGFICTSYKGWITVQVRRSIEPPDKNAADNLQKALQSVDLLSPDINQRIANAFNAFYED